MVAKVPDNGLNITDLAAGDDFSLTSDGAVISFGANSEITLTHVHNTGLTLKHTATGDDNPINLTLATGETDIAANDVIGKIDFVAPDEGTGTDAIAVAAAIQAVSEGDFSSSSNATRLEFMTGASEAATSQMTISSGGIVGIGAGVPGDLGVGLHIKTADSSGGVHTSADNLVIEDSGDSGMTILAGTGNHSRINFGDSGDNDIGQITYDHGGNAINIKTNASGSIYIDADGHVTMARQPAFSVKANAVQSNVGNNDTILFGSETFDIGSNFASDTTFTAPVTGKYQLNVGVRIDNLDMDASAYHAVTIVTSNRVYYSLHGASHWDADASYYFFSISVLADMDASDTAHLLYNENLSAADQSDVNDSSYFSGYLAC